MLNYINLFSIYMSRCYNSDYNNYELENEKDESYKNKKYINPI